MQPLILSLKFDGESQERLDALRKAHFPPRLNQLSAHLTLFHALPGEEETLVRPVLSEVCARTTPMDLEFPGVFSLGKGVAVKVDCTELEEFRRELQGRFAGLLTAQDSQKMRPHVTIQNKVLPDEARELLELLAPSWAKFEAKGTGVSLWKYLGGPWELLDEWAFSGN